MNFQIFEFTDYTWKRIRYTYFLGTDTLSL